MANVEGDEVKLITLPLGPKFQARPTRHVNGAYVDALWLQCTEDKLRGVVREINPDKFNMAAGVDTTCDRTAGRKRKSTQEPNEPTPEQALQALIVSLQSDVETEKREVKKLKKHIASRDKKITDNEKIITKQKGEISKLKKDLKKEKTQKRKSTPSKCTRCTRRAREENTPENNASGGGQVAQVTTTQPPQQSGAEMVQVLVNERDKNDKLVLNLTEQMMNTLKKVVADVVPNQQW